MTKRQLSRAFKIVVLAYSAMTVAGFVVRLADPTDDMAWYGTFKDLIPFMLAAPAAWLGSCLQRRLSYLQQLRALWSRLVEGVQSARQYTLFTRTTEPQYRAVLLRLSIVIDEVRGVFRNLGESGGKIGLYPFEPIKQIHEEIERLGWGDDLAEETRALVRGRIFKMWQGVRATMLTEFDREEPTNPNTQQFTDPAEVDITNPPTPQERAAVHAGAR